MNYILKNSILNNPTPYQIIPAVNIGDIITPAIIEDGIEITPAILATEAIPEKFTFIATIFITIEGVPAGEFIQDKMIEFTLETTEQNMVRTTLLQKGGFVSIYRQQNNGSYSLGDLCFQIYA